MLQHPLLQHTAPVQSAALHLVSLPRQRPPPSVPAGQPNPPAHQHQSCQQLAQAPRSAPASLASSSVLSPSRQLCKYDKTKLGDLHFLYYSQHGVENVMTNIRDWEKKIPMGRHNRWNNRLIQHNLASHSSSVLVSELSLMTRWVMLVDAEV